MKVLLPDPAVMYTRYATMGLPPELGGVKDKSMLVSFEVVALDGTAGADGTLAEITRRPVVLGAGVPAQSAQPWMVFQFLALKKTKGK